MKSSFENFFFDEKNRPVQIQYLRNGKIANGSPYLNIAIIKIDYSDDFEKRTYFDKKGNKKALKPFDKILNLPVNC